MNHNEFKQRSNLAAVQTILDYHFQDEELLQIALTHRSYLNERDRDEAITEHNERLEFLGDAVLDLIVTEILFEKYPTADEGFLTKLRAKIVRGDTLSKMAREMGLNVALEIGERSSGQGIELSKSVLADVYEALIAAIYLSKGYKDTYDFVVSNINRFLDFDTIEKKIDNHKSLLMEYSQSRKYSLPKYKVLSEEGPGHDKTFHVAVYIDHKKMGEGVGKSKKQAEQIAAKNAIEAIGTRSSSATVCASLGTLRDKTSSLNGALPKAR